MEYIGLIFLNLHGLLVPACIIKINAFYLKILYASPIIVKFNSIVVNNLVVSIYSLTALSLV